VTGPPTLLGVPYDASSSYLRGAALAPAAIRAALAAPSSNLSTEDGRTLNDLPWRDAGDVPVAAMAHVRAGIEAAVARVVTDGGRPVVLGGDHSISYPVVRALARASSPFSILHFDAHADLYDALDGDRYSHACPFARIMEEGVVTRLVQVGVRTLTPHQRAQADRFGVEIIDMRAFVAGARPTLEGPVYLSLDLDVLDPACAPGVSHWEPGGLTTRELLTLLQAVEAPIVGADLVEYNPLRDATGFTGMVAAKLPKELLAVMTRPIA
jgi:agmatinase